ncbi:acyl-CoA dehydrogenase family protein [Acidianus manzaensis]|uniref:Acyl-CoA dehydrogenase n=1 Tax=Acidianus manzaensis TaxID=282676 RepID=A0A1W6JWV3_9CREN|nr:acyl-CoA dehydrogenase family protein [Acidianus manzaensis]ARM74719.1 acyl-CoA dehydrogenase [Acidianus manzaensis]
MSEIVISSLKEFIKREIQPIAEKIDREDYYPRDLVSKMGDLGFLSPLYEGLNLSDTVSIIEEIAKISGSTALIQDAQGELVIEPIRVFGNNKVKREYLDKLTKGKLIGGFGLSEPCCGSDTGKIMTKAEKNGSYWKISGRKMWTTQGLYADVYLIVARTGDPKLRNKTLSVFVVPRSNCIKSNKIEVSGNRGTGTAELEINDCVVEEDNILGDINDGWKVVKYALLVGRVAISAIAIGLAEGSLAEAYEWALNRDIAGTKLIEKQGIQWYFSKNIAYLNAVKSLMREITNDGLENLQKNEDKISSLKFLSSNISQEIIDNSVQIMGGLGYAKGTRTERAYRDIRVTRIGEGTDEVQLNIIYRYLRNKGIESIM